MNAERYEILDTTFRRIVTEWYLNERTNQISWANIYIHPGWHIQRVSSLVCARQAEITMITINRIKVVQRP